MTQARFLRHLWYPACALLAACGGAAPSASPEPAGGAAPAAPAPAAAVAPDPYHPPPRDTVDAPAYKGWQQFSLQCARCHGEEAQGTSFGPSLIAALRPDGNASSREKFVNILTDGRPDQGMPSAATMGVDPAYFDGLYQYLKGRSDGRLRGGRPARRET